MIALRDVLKIMQAEDDNGNPIPFSIKVVQFDEQNMTGGDFFEVDRAVLTRTGKKSKNRFNREALAEEERIKKNPNHGANLTRNITLLLSGHIRKIHIHLITRFNGERVF